MRAERQRKLFDENETLWGPEFQSGLYAQITFNRPLRTAFTYSVPQEFVHQITVGKRVQAPFGKGNSRTTGFCVALTDQAPTGSQAIKPIVAVVDEQPLLTAAMLELTRWIADFYYCGWGQVLEAILPRAVKAKSGSRWGVFLAPTADPPQPTPELTTKQKRAYEALRDLGRPALIKEVGQAAKCGPDCVKALIEKGLVQVSRQRVSQHRLPHAAVDRQQPPELLPDQRAALEQILHAVVESQSKTFLLHGVTGSGKTEIYLQAIGEAVRRGRQAIVLVPEISLTPQTIERFRQRFDHVAVLHSHLSDVDRHWHWRQIVDGNIQVVVGARSAVFAPCTNLGLIVLDEEHENTFKQESTPRYHTRDVAIERARLERVPVILGSATPSLESWHAAQQGRYELVELPARVTGSAMPRVQILDLRGDYGKSRGTQSISRLLATAIYETVSTGGQVLLLLNRRGFSPTILCPQCGRVEMCKHCDVALTYHKEFRRLICHFCDAEFPPPAQCVECGGTAIRYSGVGTERLEDEIRTRFPDFKCARMDSDTMRSTAHYEQVLGAFRKNEVQILMGTQMIAKGLDFPNVHLVGVVTADTGRHIPDFRAAERTFQLVAQVAGRTGRGTTPGKVLVQTFNPGDPAILAAARHDYLGFVNHELPTRAEYGYPPFCRLTRIIVRSTLLEHATTTAKHLAERFRLAAAGHAGVRVLGPAPAPIARHRDFHRMHLQLHTPPDFDRLALLDLALKDADLTGDAEFAVDVDPVNLM